MTEKNKAKLLITLDDAVGDLETDGYPGYAKAIKQARSLLAARPQPKEPQAEASGEEWAKTLRRLFSTYLPEWEHRGNERGLLQDVWEAGLAARPQPKEPQAEASGEDEAYRLYSKAREAYIKCAVHEEHYGRNIEKRIEAGAAVIREYLASRPMDTDATGPWHLPKEPQAEASGELYDLIDQLCKLGNGDKDGNSDGNRIAQKARALLASRPAPTDEARAKIREALDHKILRELFGAIEDSGSMWALRLWELLVPWFEIRDEALAAIDGSGKA